MATLKQPVVRMFARALLAATVSVCSVAAWGQSANAPVAAPAKSVAPPPADLEPGVNTSAIQPSSPEPAAAPAPAPVPPVTALRRSPVAPANTASAGVPAKGASTAAAPKPGAGAGKAHDSLELDTTQITGNRELPKVLYIVPWKRSDLGDLVGKPVNSLLDEVLTPVDRDVFKRQNRYYDALKPDDAKDAAGAASDPANVKH